MAKSNTPKRLFEIDPSSPFEHRARNGTTLLATKSSLDKGQNTLVRPTNLTNAQFAQDVTEIIGFWSANILPNFPAGYGFQGYDSIVYSVRPFDEE